MSQATVVRILSIESEATRIRDEAAAQAAQIVGDFEREASSERELALSEARGEARRLRQEGERASAARRDAAISQAQADACEMEDQASQRMPAAIRHILNQVTGRM